MHDPESKALTDPSSAPPRPIAFETPGDLESAIAIVAAQLARGEPPARIEESILASPGLRPFAEPLVALCGALTHGRIAPDALGGLAGVLAVVHAHAPDAGTRAAATGQLARHAAVRASLTPATIPGIRAFALGAMVSLAAAFMWSDALRWSPSGYGVIYQLLEKLVRSPMVALGLLTGGLCATYRASGTRPVQLLRRAVFELVALHHRQSLRALDGEAALQAAAAARLPAGTLPRWTFAAASPHRLALPQTASGADALAQLEYNRALERALTVRWITELVVDMAQGGALALIVLMLCAMLI